MTTIEQPATLAARPLERVVRRRLRVSFACNNPDNGDFAGRATAANAESLYRVGRHQWDAELVHDDWGRGCPLAVDDKLMKLRIHGVWFPFKAHKTWHGNWCWDSFEFERGTGKRLLLLMRERGPWRCEAAATSFFRWWNKTPNALGEGRERGILREASSAEGATSTAVLGNRGG